VITARSGAKIPLEFLLFFADFAIFVDFA